MSCADMSRADRPQRKKADRILNLLFAFSAIAMLVLFFGRMTLASTGKIVGDIKGFDVDKEENIYVGREKWIDIIRDGAVVGCIDPPPARSYSFYIEDDTLYIGCTTGNVGGIYDLETGKLRYGEVRYEKVKSLAKGNSVTVNNHKFNLTPGFLEAYQVSRDGITVYQTEKTLFDGMLFWCCLAMFTLIFITGVFWKLSEYT